MRCWVISHRYFQMYNFEHKRNIFKLKQCSMHVQTLFHTEEWISETAVYEYIHIYIFIYIYKYIYRSMVLLCDYHTPMIHVINLPVFCRLAPLAERQSNYSRKYRKYVDWWSRYKGIAKFITAKQSRQNNHWFLYILSQIVYPSAVCSQAYKIQLKARSVN